MDNDIIFINSRISKEYHKEIQVYVQDTKGNIHTIDLNPRMSVEEFRNKACDYIGEKYEIIQHIFVMRGSCFLDLKMNLQDSGVNNESELKLVYIDSQVEKQGKDTLFFMKNEGKMKQNDGDDDFPLMRRHAFLIYMVMMIFQVMRRHLGLQFIW